MYKHILVPVDGRYASGEPILSRSPPSRKIVCTQQIVHTMLKESETPRYPTRRTHRTYTPEFKAELVSALAERGHHQV